MTEVMTQDEIDKLLEAISGDSNSGAVDDSNLKGSSKSVNSATGRKQKIKLYDFKRPDKFSKEQVRTIASMHESFSRLTTTSLSALLRTMAHVRVVSVDQLTYEEFIRSIPNPTTLAVINMDPLKGSSILEIDPTITFSIVDRLFGGKGDGAKDVKRDLTEIEQSVMESIVVRLLANLREAWAQVVDLRPRLGQIEVNPQFAQIVPPTEMVVLVTLEVKINDVEGMMNFCIPYITIEPIVSKLSAQYWYSSVRKGATTENFITLQDKLSTITVDVIAEIGKASLNMKDVLALKVGDVIRLTETEINQPMAVRVGNQQKFEGRPGVIGNKVAIQITNKISDLDYLDFEELHEGEE